MALKYMPRTHEGRAIVRDLRALEAEVLLLAELRRLTKNDSETRLNEFGRALLALASESDIKQSFMASLLDITPGAVSRQINR
ncbi:hypothetical protein [Sphingomonas sp.]|jgi:hypothetical protein|uniref:hypothetical protein n=1 Tax=Sphingomonas sp. TaxID=28214 RepID=UPI002EDAD171